MSSIIPLAAISFDLALKLLLALFVLFILLQISLVIIAARRGVLWFLACLFVPFATVVLVIVDSRARRNFFLQILVAIASFCVGFGTLNADQRKSVMSTGKLPEESENATVPSTENTSVESGDSPTLAQRQDRIRVWQKKLEVMKRELPAGDSPQKVAFDRELAEYLAELEKVKAAMPLAR